MSFKDALDAEIAGQRKGPRCTICALADTLDPDDWTDLQASLADATITNAVIARALAREGIKVAHFTVSRHRSAHLG